MRQITFIACLLVATNTFAQHQLRVERLREDFDYLIEELKLQHQGYYEYCDTAEVNRKTDSLRNTLRPMSRLEFYKMLRYTLGLTNEGHTSISLPKWSMVKLGLSGSFMPLAVRFLDKKLIITQNYGKKVPGLSKGDQILKVNGRSVEDITKQIFPLIPTDGFNKTSQYAWSSGVNFSLLYRLVYGKTKTYELEVQHYGTSESKFVTISAVSFTKFKSKNAQFESIDFDYGHFMFEQINDSTGYLSIPGFGEDNFDYEAFYRKEFKKIDSLQIRHLIIDMQANGGGTEGNENLLYSYLVKEPIRKYKRVTMMPKPYQKHKEDEGYIFDKWKLGENIAKRGAFTLYSDYYSDLEYHKPEEAFIYSGKVYVLISGKTFSGGAEFASLVKMSGRGLFIGEETGGAYEGNVSGYAEYIKLPNSKIEVKIPTVHFQINVNPGIKGHGVMPDYEISQSWSDYMDGINTKKAFAVHLVNGGQK